MSAYDEIKKKMQRVYDKQFTPGGWCKNCTKQGGDESCKFRFDKVKIGKKYGTDSEYSKILFVGIEGLHKAGTGIVTGIGEPSDTAYNPHFKGVRYVAAYILQRMKHAAPPQNALKSSLQEFNNTIPYIALTNFYKCAFGSGSVGLVHTSSMDENCPPIVLREIDVLKPDLVVIQTTRRPANFMEELTNRYGEGKRIAGEDDKTALFLHKKEGAKPLLILYTYHGSSDPYPEIRSWTNGKKGEFKYIIENLNPVLDRAVETLQTLAYASALQHTI